MLRRITDYLKKVISPISRILGGISMVAIVFVTLLVVVDVCLRRLFNSPIFGSHELSSLSFSIIVFLPLAWCAFNNNHVELDLVVKKLPKTTQSSIEVIILLLTSGILGLMSWQLLIQGMKLQAANQETALLEIPMYPFIYIATLGSIILTLAFFIRFLYSLSTIIEKRR